MKLVKALAMLLALLGCFNVYAFSVIDVSAEQSIDKLGKRMKYSLDETEKLSASEILKDQTIFWQDIDDDVPSFGFDNSSFWFMLKFSNKSPQSIEKLITVNYPLLDKIDFYLFDDTHLIKQVKSGDSLVFNQRQIKHRNFIFPLEIASNQQITVLFNMKTEGAAQLPMSMVDPLEFEEDDQLRLMVEMLFIGSMLAVAAYNLILFVFIRESSYIYYVAYISSYCLFYLTIKGISFQWLWPNGIGWNEKLMFISLCCSVWFATLFSIKFLNLKQTDKTIYSMLLFLFISAFITFIASFFISYSIVVQIIIFLIFIGSLIIFRAGISQWLKGNQAAKLYSIALVVYWVSASLNGLNKFGLIPRNSITEHATMIGTIIQVFLLSLALAERFNAEKRKNFELQKVALEHEKHALEVQRRANEELEGRVQYRTKDLEKALNELSIANIELNNLRTIDSLTQVKNRTYFDETIYKEWKRASRSNSSLALMIIDIDFFKKINDTHGHLAGDEALKQVAQIISLAVNRPSDTLARYGGEEFTIILPHTKFDGAMILAEKVRLICEQSVLKTRNTELKVTVSIGVSAVDDVLNNGLEISDLIDSADKALYKSKENGRNQVNGSNL